MNDPFQQAVDTFFSKIKSSSPRDKFKKIQELIDLRMSAARQPNSPPISCRISCAQCCSLPVDACSEEVDVILSMNVALDSVQTSRLRLQRQAGADNWQSLSATDKKCIFLNSYDNCSIYADRPLMCRKMRVTSDPQYCGSSDPQMRRKINYDVEIIAEKVVKRYVNEVGFSLFPQIIADKLGL